MGRKLEIRGASGLGDAIYVYPVAKYYKEQGYDVLVRTKWPDIYTELNVSTTHFYKIPKADITAAYSNRKYQSTNQYVDVLINSKLPEDTPFLIDWTIKDHKLVDRIRAMAGDKKVCVLSMPHQPFARPDRYGDSLRPRYKNMQVAMDFLKKNNWFIVQIGHGACLERLKGIDFEIQNRTTVKDLMDICSIADGFLGQVGFIIPIAEAFNKPLFALFSLAGLRSSDKFIAGIKGEKILSRDSSVFCVDNEDDKTVIRRVSRVFL